MSCGRGSIRYLSAWVGVLGACCALFDAARVDGASCVGDCSADRIVTVDEIVRGVRLALGEGQLVGCGAFDTDGDARVTVNEIVASVHAALEGCDPPDCVDLPIEVAPRCCATEPPPAAILGTPRCIQAGELLLGRNLDGFGRIDDCERIPLLRFAQGGIALRFHALASCLDAAQPIAIEVHLRSADEVFVDDTRFARFSVRGDGWLEERSLTFELPFPTFPEQYEGVECTLDVRVTDAHGATQATRKRIMLTLLPVADEPDPK